MLLAPIPVSRNIKNLFNNLQKNKVTQMTIKDSSENNFIIDSIKFKIKLISFLNSEDQKFEILIPMKSLPEHKKIELENKSGKIIFCNIYALSEKLKTLLNFNTAISNLNNLKASKNIKRKDYKLSYFKENYETMNLENDFYNYKEKYIYCKIVYKKNKEEEAAHFLKSKNLPKSESESEYNNKKEKIILPKLNKKQFSTIDILQKIEEENYKNNPSLKNIKYKNLDKIENIWDGESKLQNIKLNNMIQKKNYIPTYNFNLIESVIATIHNTEENISYNKNNFNTYENQHGKYHTLKSEKNLINNFYVNVNLKTDQTLVNTEGYEGEGGYVNKRKMKNKTKFLTEPNLKSNLKTKLIKNLKQAPEKLRVKVKMNKVQFSEPDENENKNEKIGRLSFSPRNKTDSLIYLNQQEESKKLEKLKRLMEKKLNIINPFNNVLKDNGTDMENYFIQNEPEESSHNLTENESSSNFHIYNEKNNKQFLVDILEERPTEENLYLVDDTQTDKLIIDNIYNNRSVNSDEKSYVNLSSLYEEILNLIKNILDINSEKLIQSSVDNKYNKNIIDMLFYEPTFYHSENLLKKIKTQFLFFCYLNNYIELRLNYPHPEFNLENFSMLTNNSSIINYFYLLKDELISLKISYEKNDKDLEEKNNFHNFILNLNPIEDTSFLYIQSFFFNLFIIGLSKNYNERIDQNHVTSFLINLFVSDKNEKILNNRMKIGLEGFIDYFILINENVNFKDKVKFIKKLIRFVLKDEDFLVTELKRILKVNDAMISKILLLDIDELEKNNTSNKMLYDEIERLFENIFSVFKIILNKFLFTIFYLFYFNKLFFFVYHNIYFFPAKIF